MQKEWHETYGPVVGYFMGKIPVLAITDIELLKLIEIKDFMDFADRPVSGIRMYNVRRVVPLKFSTPDFI